jgi:hypothetical protein
VETGLQHGEGVKQALNAGFETIYSIELRKVSCDEGEKKFAQQRKDGKVHIIHGRSEEQLGPVISKINEPITFWLDAHLAPGHLTTIGTDEYGVWCPLYSELEHIARHPVKNHIILIDDIDRLDEEYNWTEEVKLDIIKSKVLEINPHYTISLICGGSILYARLEAKTIAFDIDDVICFRDETSSAEFIIGPEKYEGCSPNQDKIRLVNECYDAGYIIILYTSRGMGQFNGDSERCELELTEVTTRLLNEWGVRYHQIVFGKIHFDLLVDDKTRDSNDIHTLNDVKVALGD